MLYRENVGNIWARNQHITHFLPKSCQYIPHPHNISPFSPTISPQIVNKSTFSPYVPHFKIKILYTNPHFVNAFLSKNLTFLSWKMIINILSTFILSLSAWDLWTLFKHSITLHSNLHNLHNILHNISPKYARLVKDDLKR